MKIWAQFMRSFNHRVPEFIRSVSVLALGALISQAIAFSFTPVLTRLYTPSEFGVFVTFLSWVTVVGGVIAGRYELAILLPKVERHARYVVALSSTVALFGFVICFSAVSVYASLNFKMHSAYLYLIQIAPPAILLLGLINIFRMFRLRKGDYSSLAKVQVLQSSSMGLAQTLLGLLNPTAIVLAVGYVLSIFCSASYLFPSQLLSSLRLTRKKILTLVAIAKRYSDQIKFGAPALLVSGSAQESLILLVGLYMAPEIAGYVALINRVIGVPARILGNSLGEVFFKRVSQLKRGSAYQPVRNFVIGLFLFSLPSFALFYMVVDYLFAPLFGEEWIGALELLPYLAIVAALSFVFSPVSYLFNYYLVQRWNLIWQAVWLISNILVFAAYEEFSLTATDTFMLYAVKQSALYVIAIAAFTLYSRQLRGV